jgi:hypothetical protein
MGFRKPVKKEQAGSTPAPSHEDGRLAGVYDSGLKLFERSQAHLDVPVA